MRANSSDSAVKRRILAAAACGLFAAAGLPAVDWYLSNPAGIAMRATVAAVAAAAEWAIGIERIAAADLPPALAVHSTAGGYAERRTLTAKGTVRSVAFAVFDRTGFEIARETAYADGRIDRDLYDQARRLAEEWRLEADGTGSLTRYAYEGSLLASATTAAVAPAAQAGGAPTEETLWTDTFNYLRTGALRSVLRSFKSPEYSGRLLRVATRLGVPSFMETGYESGPLTYTSYDAAGRPIARRQYDANGKPVGDAETIDYGPATAASGPRPSKSRTVDPVSGEATESDFDAAGRLLKRTVTDAAGETIAVLEQEWSAAGPTLIRESADGAVALTLYYYGADGAVDREENYRNGTLERTLARRTADGTEIEELYRYGQVALRAVWSRGVKLSEERFVVRREGKQ
jgi:hypothetical protein